MQLSCTANETTVGEGRPVHARIVTSNREHCESTDCVAHDRRRCCSFISSRTTRRRHLTAADDIACRFIVVYGVRRECGCALQSCYYRLCRIITLPRDMSTFQRGALLMFPASRIVSCCCCCSCRYLNALLRSTHLFKCCSQLQLRCCC